MEDTIQFSIKDYLTVLRKRLIWIILAAVVAGAVAAVFGEFVIADKYTCSLTCLLGDSNMSAAEYSQLAKNTERSQYVLGTRDVVEKVVVKAHIIDSETGEPAVLEMLKATSISADTNRGSYKISVTTGDPDVSYAMVIAYRDLMPTLIEENHLFVATVTECSEEAPLSPSNGGRTLKYGAIGFLIGGVIMYGIFVVNKILDVTIYTVEDLTAATDIPIIGMIPRYTGTVEGSPQSGMRNPIGKNN